SDYTVAATDCFKPVSKYWDRIVRPEQLMNAAINAMRVLTDPADTGTVTLALPQDVQAEAYDYPEAFFSKRVHYVERRLPARDAVQRAVELIKSKKRPIIIAGGGVRYSAASDELKAFAEALGIPVAETQAGKGSISWKHPLNVGGIGVTGALAANKLAKEADLIIGVGTRYSDFTTASKSAFLHPEAQFLNININGMDSAKLGGLSLTGDAKETLAMLKDSLADISFSGSYGGEVARLRTEWENEVDRLYALEWEGGLAQTRALGVINETIGEDAVVVCAAGSLPGDLQRLWRVGKPGGYHMEYGFSCMGYEVSGAFGAALAEKDRDVYALVGDGSYLMLHSELVTSLQEGRKLTILLFDNHGYQCIHNLQRGNGSDGFGNEFRYREAETGRYTGDFMPIDFAAHARSLGAASYKANTAEELREAIVQAKQETRTTLIEIPVVPGTNTDGYESWWNVGVPAVSESGKVLEAHAEMQKRLQTAKAY
ncbi:3D-(3,5/4)-trihydroxycyclohexane-1,2-dione acylhydrolase (decyclizing), partial [Paenibacillus sepulcri]|nr:3D-(3,5/4)-trihydroxycyclohexane-1,2-dione acylhydrolase (decyclizing) [Paenibacillus sepulcri]